MTDSIETTGRTEIEKGYFRQMIGDLAQKNEELTAENQTLKQQIKNLVDSFKIGEWAAGVINEDLTAENKQLREINEAQAMDAWAHEVYLEKIAAVEADKANLTEALEICEARCTEAINTFKETVAWEEMAAMTGQLAGMERDNTRLREAQETLINRLIAINDRGTQEAVSIGLYHLVKELKATP